MFDLLSKLFCLEKIEHFGILPISECKIINQGLLERRVPFAKSVIGFLIPYYVKAEDDSNISLYAVSRDYHRFIREVTNRIIKSLNESFPQKQFAGMGDHSPIDEVNAAAKMGLGIIGDNGCIINSKYGSYVFIAEIFTDIDIHYEPVSIAFCEHCGLCQNACPSREHCLSDLTQQKGSLTQDTIALMRRYNTAWGCDICQNICPHNKGISTTPIDFFHKERISKLTPEIIASMSDEELDRRAYGWRKRKTIERNIKVISE